MRKLSDRGLVTVVTMIVLVISIVGVIVINNIQDVQSREWCDHIGEVSVDE